MKDWINEWYKDQFDKIDLTPSSNVWDNISQTMEDWPKHWYASNVNDLGTKPRETTWDQLNSHLTDQRRIKRSNRFSYAAAAIISILLIVIPLNTEDSLFSDYFQNEYVANLMLSDDILEVKEIGDIIQEEFVQQLNSTQLSANISENKDVRESLAVRSLDAINLKRLNQRFSDVKLVIRKDYDEKIVSAQNSIETLPVLRSSFEENGLTSGLKFRENSYSENWFEVSILPQLSSLNNPLSQSAISSNSEKLTVMPSMTYSISAGHKFDRRNGLKLALLMNNQKGLRTSSSNSVRNIDLNYLSLAALYTSSWKLGQYSRFAFNTEIGIIAGFNTNKDVFFNDERVDYLENGYGKIDAGVIMGASISTRLSNHWSLSTGLNSQIGLINVFNGNETIPSDFFRTTTQSIGLNIGLVRRF